MIQIIRPVPRHLDAEHVARLATMKPDLVRSYLHEYRLQRMERTDRYDRDAADKAIEACQFVLSECEPFECRIARERADMARLQFHVDQHRDLVSRLEQELREHAMALDELCLLAQQVEVAA